VSQTGVASREANKASCTDVSSSTNANSQDSGPVIRLKNLKKSFGKQVVLDGVSIDFPRGKTTVIMGPSGCGKSVTLKHIVGLLHPDAGEVWFEDTRVDHLRERELASVRLQIGFLFQLSALFDSMTVGENLEFPLIEHTDFSPAQRKARIDESLSLVDMHGAENKIPSELSGGQRKRVALARAIVLQPRVVLYDEPTTGLDPIRSDGIDQLVTKLRDCLHVTSIVVTHDMNSARKVSDKAVLLLNGKVEAEGTFKELEANPDFRVQQFLQGVYRREDDAEERVSTPGQAAN
jgi:phospholipid/cholesterol/gamma-HCH transport system ATP-binding protein